MYKHITSNIITVGITPILLQAGLIGRKYILLQHIGSGTLYVANTFVTADTANTGGRQLTPRSLWGENYTHNVDVYGVVVAGSTQVYVEEGK